MEHMVAYDWPGNIRELENVIKRLVILGNEQQIIEELTQKIDNRRKVERTALETSFVEATAEESGGVSLKHMSRNLTSTAEKEVILRALQQTQWNRKQAASMLNVSYKTLLNKIRKLDIK
jgi:two-component system response regulator AtoC